MNRKLLLTLLISALVLVFILQNTATVQIHFLFWSLSMSRSLLVVVLVAVGTVIGWLLKSFVSLRVHRH